jgi:hypothetical protein
MQPVNDNHIQSQIFPPRQRTYEKRESASNGVRIPLRKNKDILPEDVVTLSSDRSSALSLKKDPSSPVTTAESKALRDAFSVYA